MMYWDIFLAFFIPSIIGYGGGPAFIPLIENEVVGRYGWMSVSEFSRVLALGNALPGPIATKMAGFIGYEQGGVLGSFVAVFATVAPSLILMLALLGLLYRYKDSPRVKRMTLLIRPTIAVLLGLMAYRFFAESWGEAGALQTLALGALAWVLMERLRVHPAWVILGSLAYGGVFLG